MDEELSMIIGKLSSKRVMQRKAAIKALKARLGGQDGHMARLALHYVAEHDPCYTVRNVARQAFYKVSAPPESGASWERAFVFQSE